MTKQSRDRCMPHGNNQSDLTSELIQADTLIHARFCLTSLFFQNYPRLGRHPKPKSNFWEVLFAELLSGRTCFPSSNSTKPLSDDRNCFHFFLCPQNKRQKQKTERHSQSSSTYNVRNTLNLSHAHLKQHLFWRICFRCFLHLYQQTSIRQ